MKQTILTILIPAQSVQMLTERRTEPKLTRIYVAIWRHWVTMEKQKHLEADRQNVNAFFMTAFYIFRFNMAVNATDLSN